MSDTSGIITDGQSYVLDDACLVVDPPPPTITIMGANNAPLVTIHPDGTLDYGPAYTPDEAARAFWEAMRIYTAVRCERCGHLPGHELA